MNPNISFRRLALPLSLILLGLMLLTGHAHGAAFTPTRFTVVDAGTPGKPDVVFLPGLSSSRDVWAAEAKLLAPEYRLHLLQVNGFAGQPAGLNASGDVLPAIVEELHGYIATGHMHPAVVGHSLGGLLALMLAEKHPSDVRKLVLVDALPFYSMMYGPDTTVASIAPRLAAMREQMMNLPADQYAAMQTMTAAALVKDADGQKQVAASSAASDRTVMVNAMLEDMRTDVRGELAAVSTPTLMLYPFEPGRQKQDEIDALYTGAYKAMPHVQLQRVDGSRHFVMYDQPAAMHAALQSFLK